MYLDKEVGGRVTKIFLALAHYLVTRRDSGHKEWRDGISPRLILYDPGYVFPLDMNRGRDGISSQTHFI